MGLDKVLASQDHPVGKISDPAKQVLGQRQFAILLLNDPLSGSQVKGRRFVCAAGTRKRRGDRSGKEGQGLIREEGGEGGMDRGRKDVSELVATEVLLAKTNEQTFSRECDASAGGDLRNTKNS